MVKVCWIEDFLIGPYNFGVSIIFVLVVDDADSFIIVIKLWVIDKLCG